MKFIRKLKSNTLYDDIKLNLPYPFLIKTIDEKDIHFGEIFNFLVLTYDTVEEDQEIALISEDYDNLLKNIQDIYIYPEEVDGEKERIDPVKSLSFKSPGKHKVEFLLKKSFDSFGKLFSDVSNLSSIEFNKFHSIYRKPSDISYMFKNCSLIDSISFYSVDTSEIFSMEGVFQGCSSLSSVTMMYPITNLNNVDNMFDGVAEVGTFYYNPDYDYQKIIDILPPGWQAIEMISCFAAGFWINEQPWSNEYTWRNNQ